jgi:hypothetical protein
MSPSTLLFHAGQLAGEAGTLAELDIRLRALPWSPGMQRVLRWLDRQSGNPALSMLALLLHVQQRLAAGPWTPELEGLAAACRHQHGAPSASLSSQLAARLPHTRAEDWGFA